MSCFCSASINSKCYSFSFLQYAVEIQLLYHNPTIWGKVCRRVLAKPVTYYNVIKSKDMMTVSRTPVHLPPRIYLRFLANKHLISYFLVFLLITYWLGYNPVFTVLILFFAILLFIFIAAILYPVPEHCKNDWKIQHSILNIVKGWCNVTF